MNITTYTSISESRVRVPLTGGKRYMWADEGKVGVERANLSLHILTMFIKITLWGYEQSFVGHCALFINPLTRGIGLVCPSKV